MALIGLFFPHEWSVSAFLKPIAMLPALFGILIAFFFFFFCARDATFPATAPKRVKGDWPVLGSLGFFTRRWDFFQEAMERSPTGNFTFHAGQYPVVGLSGEEGRKLFFESKALDLTAGSVCAETWLFCGIG